MRTTFLSDYANLQRGYFIVFSFVSIGFGGMLLSFCAFNGIRQIAFSLYFLGLLLLGIFKTHIEGQENMQGKIHALIGTITFPGFIVYMFVDFFLFGFDYITLFFSVSALIGLILFAIDWKESKGYWQRMFVFSQLSWLTYLVINVLNFSNFIEW